MLHLRKINGIVDLLLEILRNQTAIRERLARIESRLEIELSDP